jgi:hypothetical protein
MAYCHAKPSFINKACLCLVQTRFFEFESSKGSAAKKDAKG